MDQEDADETLVARCQRGDGAAFGLLVGRYERVVFNAAFRMLGNRDEARDAAQAVFLKVLENLHRFDPRFRFYSWLYKIALNESLDMLEHRGRHAELTDVHEAKDDPARDASVADAGWHVQRAIAGLKLEHRTVIVMRHYQALSYEEIGQALELPVKTVKSRLYEAREQLREQLVVAGVEA